MDDFHRSVILMWLLALIGNLVFWGAMVWFVFYLATRAGWA